MSEVIAEVPASGWYQDPNDDDSMRWWDGEGWTDHTQPIRPARTPTVSAPAPAGADWVSNYTDDELALYTGRTAEHSVASHTGRTVLEFTGTVPDWRRDRTSATTGSVWLLALSPVLTAGVVVAWLMVGAGMGLPPVTLLGVTPILALVTILFAVADARTLAARGVPAASAWWILLGPVVYLIARAVTVRRSGASGIAPLAVNVVVSALVGAIVGLGSVALVATFAPRAEDGPGTGQQANARQTEQVIQSELQSTGQDWKVDCSAAAVRITPNSSFQCTATRAADAAKSTVAVVLDAEGKMTYTLAPAS
ncbi:MAG: DUF2510 domain-containing protein [Micrococcales bacterium]|nr:DUF2510 domain-containing protein [Micrococcales bacterium]